jgi:hypothetical protein
MMRERQHVGLLWGSLVSIGMIFLSIGGAFVAAPAGAEPATGAVGAAPVGAPLAPITDYATYPPALPAGCPGGPSALVDPMWSNGRGGNETDLRRLNLAGGDVLTLTWSELAPGCQNADGTPAVTISLVAYDAGDSGVVNAAPDRFDPSIDQRLLVSTSCGAEGGACTMSGGHWTLSLTIPEPSPDLSCNFQAGGVLGLPLAVVGPNGSYYSQVLRGDSGPTMLIGATNFGIPGCEAGVSPTSIVGSTTTVLPTTSTPATTQPVTSTSQPVTTTSEGAGVSPTSIVGSTTTQAVTTTSAGAGVSPSSVAVTSTTIGTDVEAATVSRAAGTLPLTGPRHAGDRTAAGLALVLVGGVLLVAGISVRRLGRRPIA